MCQTFVTPLLAFALAACMHTYMYKQAPAMHRHLRYVFVPHLLGIGMTKGLTHVSPTVAKGVEQVGTMYSAGCNIYASAT